MSESEFKKKTKVLIDDLKSVCANYGLGNHASEFDIITQVFLYKYLNDKLYTKPNGLIQYWPKLKTFRPLTKQCPKASGNFCWLVSATKRPVCNPSN
ncbi:hypothetical protein [Siphonobacter sp. SORGH_AS_0500]|uniref:hypothetical protein n=1 Tax=Siphonobacter sp. SORGH_AS_0500 TaxID=1864824 RepID=UPI001E41F24F|nr:hypothetical protein [Siphonobacter sp. SORGH_AS_0500]